MTTLQPYKCSILYGFVLAKYCSDVAVFFSGVCDDASCALELVVDRAAEEFHGNDGRNGDEDQNQCVLDQGLPLLVLDHLFYEVHEFSPLGVFRNHVLFVLRGQN